MAIDKKPGPVPSTHLLQALTGYWSALYDFFGPAEANDMVIFECRRLGMSEEQARRGIIMALATIDEGKFNGKPGDGLEAGFEENEGF